MSRVASLSIQYSSDLSQAKAAWESFARDVESRPLRLRFGGADTSTTPIGQQQTFGGGSGTPFIGGSMPLPLSPTAQLSGPALAQQQNIAMRALPITPFANAGFSNPIVPTATVANIGGGAAAGGGAPAVAQAGNIGGNLQTRIANLQAGINAGQAQIAAMQAAGPGFLQRNFPTFMSGNWLAKAAGVGLASYVTSRILDAGNQGNIAMAAAGGNMAGQARAELTRYEGYESAVALVPGLGSLANSLRERFTGGKAAIAATVRDTEFNDREEIVRSRSRSYLRGLSNTARISSASVYGSYSESMAAAEVGFESRSIQSEQMRRERLDAVAERRRNALADVERKYGAQSSNPLALRDVQAAEASARNERARIEEQYGAAPGQNAAIRRAEIIVAEQTERVRVSGIATDIRSNLAGMGGDEYAAGKATIIGETNTAMMAAGNIQNRILAGAQGATRLAAYDANAKRQNEIAAMTTALQTTSMAQNRQGFSLAGAISGIASQYDPEIKQLQRSSAPGTAERITALQQQRSEAISGAYNAFYSEQASVYGGFRSSALRSGGMGYEARQNDAYTRFASSTVGKSPFSSGYMNALTGYASEKMEIETSRRYANIDVNDSLQYKQNVLAARRNRDPVGGALAGVAAGYISEWNNISRSSDLSVADKTEKLKQLRANAKEEFSLAERDYGMSFRGTQYDLKNLMVNNPRDQENPTEVMKTIQRTLEGVLSRLDNLIGN